MDSISKHSAIVACFFELEVQNPTCQDTSQPFWANYAIEVFLCIENAATKLKFHDLVSKFLTLNYEIINARSSFERAETAFEKNLFERGLIKI